MAGFEDAIKYTLAFEGGYANDPNDSGGETYKGISRRAHPDWQGWLLVDAAKKGAKNAAGINDRLKGDLLLDELVKEVYREGYWKPLGKLPERVRMKVFDMAVNAGSNRAARLLQTALNALGAKLAVDGLIGPATRGALGSFSEDDVLNALCSAQRGFYQNLARTKPANAKFLKGWLARAAWKP